MANTPRSQPCRFFSIPPELRNRIYRLALVKPAREDIEISLSGFDRPALLNICKQVRFEALKIYYYENVFNCTIHRYNSASLVAFERTIRQLGLHFDSVKRTSQTIYGTPNWRNLVEWVKHYWTRAALARPQPPSEIVKWKFEPEMYIVGSMFAVAKQLRGQPVALLEAVLEDMRPGLVQLDKRWSEG